MGMYKAIFYYWVEDGEDNASVVTEIPFVPEIGAEVWLVIKGEKRGSRIEDVKYVFDENNNFKLFQIDLGWY